MLFKEKSIKLQRTYLNNRIVECAEELKRLQDYVSKRDAIGWNDYRIMSFRIEAKYYIHCKKQIPILQARIQEYYKQEEVF